MVQRECLHTLVVYTVCIYICIFWVPFLFMEIVKKKTSWPFPWVQNKYNPKRLNCAESVLTGFVSLFNFLFGWLRQTHVHLNFVQQSSKR